MRTSTPSVVIATRAATGDRRRSSVVVRTPLELILALDDQPSIGTAVLADDFAEGAVAAFLRETYPGLRLVTLRGREPSLASA